MNLTNLKILTGACCLVPLLLTAQTSKREVMAVGEFKPTEALKADMARRGKTIELERVVQGLDGHFISSLNGTRKFTLVGRSDLKDILKEQDLGNSGIVDPSTAAEQGKVKRAKWRVTTSLDGFLDNRETQDFGNGRKGFKRRIQLSAQAKVYDASTGELLEAPNIQLERIDVLTGDAATNLAEDRTDEQLARAARELAEKCAARIVDVVYPAKVLDVEDKVVTINRGDSFGIRVGQVVNVFGPAKVIRDEDSGEVVKRKGALLGRVKITSVEPTYSQGEILDGTITKNSLVSLPETQEAAK